MIVTMNSQGSPVPVAPLFGASGAAYSVPGTPFRNAQRDKAIRPEF
jgi:hypothetical protein